MTERNTPDEDRGDRAERAFRDALRHHADEPDFQPLELPIPAGRRAGLPRWLPAAAAVVLVAAVAIPLAITQLRGNSPSSAVPAAAPERGPGDTASEAPGTTNRPGWRWESYRALSYQVPDRWGYAYAPRADWCADRAHPPSEPFVALAAELTPIRAIGCLGDLPASYLQTFVSVRPVDNFSRGWELPAGWTATTSKAIDGYLVEVVHTKAYASVADQIVASVRAIGEIDPNGCPARSALQPKPGNPAVAGKALVPVSLCQYDLAVSPAQLVASKALADDDERLDYSARQVMAALAKAPKGSGPDEPTCDAVGDTAVLVRLHDGSIPSLGSEVVVRYSGCQGNGIFTASGSHQLTAEACQAVLQRPLILTTGHGPAGRLCGAPGERTPATTPAPTASQGPPTVVPPSVKPGTTPTRK